MSRILRLGEYKVNLDGYKRNVFLERGNICWSLTGLLNAASIRPIYHVRFLYTASDSFVSRLQADGDESLALSYDG